MSNEDGDDRTSRRPGLAAIEVHQVSKRFGEVRAVHGVSFTIERGSICALLGTTTLAMLLGLVTRAQGRSGCSATIRRAQHGKPGYAGGQVRCRCQRQQPSYCEYHPFEEERPLKDDGQGGSTCQRQYLLSGPR